MSAQGDEPKIWLGDSPPTKGNGGQRGPGPNGRGWMRWVAVAIGFAVLIAVIAAQHYLGGNQGATPGPSPSVSTASAMPTSGTNLSTAAASRTSSSTLAISSPPLASPTGPTALGTGTTPTIPVHRGPKPYTTTIAAPFVSLPQSADWEVVGFQWSQKMSVGPFNVVRYEPSTQKLTTTPLPGPTSTGPVSFVATRNAAIIRPVDRVPGYLVQDGQQAKNLPGALASGAAVVFPGPDGNHVWTLASGGSGLSIREVGTDGSPTGTTITVPGKLQIPWYQLSPDGAGFILGRGPDGAYDLRPDGAHLVTHGQVLAAGPTGYVINDCDDPQCGMSVLERNHATSTTVPAPPGAPSSPGILSPDGRYAAIAEAWSQSVTLTNLATGRSTTVFRALGGGEDSGYLPTMAFTPDSDYLLVVTGGGLVPVDTATLTHGPTLAIPDLVAVAVQPAN